jgi:hypothetical protein
LSLRLSELFRKTERERKRGERERRGGGEGRKDREGGWRTAGSLCEETKRRQHIQAKEEERKQPADTMTLDL